MLLRPPRVSSLSLSFCLQQCVNFEVLWVTRLSFCGNFFTSDKANAGQKMIKFWRTFTSACWILNGVVFKAHDTFQKLFPFYEFRVRWAFNNSSVVCELWFIVGRGGRDERGLSGDLLKGFQNKLVQFFQENGDFRSKLPFWPLKQVFKSNLVQKCSYLELVKRNLGPNWRLNLMKSSENLVRLFLQ